MVIGSRRIIELEAGSAVGTTRWARLANMAKQLNRWLDGAEVALDPEQTASLHRS